MSLDEFTDDTNKVKGTINSPRRTLDISSPSFVDDFVAEQMETARQSLNDAFIAETITKISSILKDPKHPAHYAVRQLVLEAQDATQST